MAELALYFFSGCPTPNLCLSRISLVSWAILVPRHSSGIVSPQRKSKAQALPRSFRFVGLLQNRPVRPEGGHWSETSIRSSHGFSEPRMALKSQLTGNVFDLVKIHMLRFLGSSELKKRSFATEPKGMSFYPSATCNFRSRKIDSAA